MQTHTNSGIPGVGPIEWGSHFCQFYDTADDLADTLVPYFKQGLDNNEKCLWVTAEPYGVDAATASLRAAVPDFDRKTRRGDIEIVNYEEWYARSGSMSPDEVIDSWLGHSARALHDGYSGLRLTGNLYWVSRNDWHTFNEYESRLNHAFCGHRMVALCSYCLEKTWPSGVLDIVRNHQFAVARREGNWEIIESATLKATKAELRMANDRLKQRVAEQTATLRQELAHREVLFRELHHRVKNNLQVVCSLLALKARQFREPAVAEAFNVTLARVRSMGQVHEALYSRHDTESLDFGDYLVGLCRNLSRAYPVGSRVGIKVSSDHGVLDLDKAVPLGLIATELVSNAFKHAFPAGRAGQIMLCFFKSRGKGELTIADDGIGLTDQALDAARRGNGLGLIRSLVAQLDGSVHLDNREGTHIRIEFPTS